MIPATITPEDAARRVWDAIVIGAGPAGAVAARQAALDGSRVLLVEAKSFPRAKVCGSCLNGGALAVLQSVGLATLTERLGGKALERFDLRSGGRSAALRLPAGIALSRYRFDAGLVEEAIGASVDFLPETFATVGDLSDCGSSECRLVSLKTHDGSVAEIRARIVLCSDGLAHASLREQDGFCSRVAVDCRVGLGGQVHDYASEDYHAGTIFMAVGRRGYVGLVRVEDESLNIAAALAPEFVKNSGGAASAISSVLTEAGFPQIPAIERTAWQGTIELTRRPPRTAGRRVLLLGDAAGYVEPFTGEGIAWALSAGQAAAPFVQRAHGEWGESLEHEWEDLLRQLVLNRQRWCRWLAFALRHPLVVRSIVTAISRAPQLAAPVLRDLNRPPQSARS